MIRKMCLMFTAIICCAVIAAVVSPSAEAANVTPHARNCASAIEIRPGGEVTTVLESTEDHAVYKIVLDKRGLLDVWTDPGSMDIWTMELLDDSCNPITAVKGGVSVMTGNYARLTIPSTDLITNETVSTLAAGTYFIRVNPEPIDVFGDKFTIHTKFMPHFGNDCATAEPMRMNSSMMGALLYPADREVFRVEIRQPGRIHAIAVNEEGNLPPVSFLLADCSNATSMTSGEEDPEEGGIGIVTALLKPGVYFLAVSPSGAPDLGPYEFAVGFSPKDDLLLDPDAFEGVCEGK